MSEIYAEDTYFPASLLSDGTINIIALIVALYFEDMPFIIIEEPERNIHPHLISRVINMLKDVSPKKQIIITTHNPQIVKYADLEDLLLISRNDKGYSEISKPAENEEIKAFLEEELGIEELYVSNLLK
jgi:predicted ATPase